MNKPIRTLENLSHHQLIKQDDISGLQAVVEQFSLSITEEMHALIDKDNPKDPIAMQFVPRLQELSISSEERQDPIGDEAFAKTKGIIHRYPDRCLFTPVHVCPVYCRFCFRREKLGEATATLSPEELDNAFEYIQQHQAIWEVILTGGDPLILKPSVLQPIIKRLEMIPHVEVIRIHTRVPIVDSKRIHQNMINALRCDKALYVVLHANHPKEFTARAIKACKTIVEAGIPMLGQTVLLKDINDNIDTLSQLMRCFVKNRIKPYYLHQGDLVKGTQHFRSSIPKGQALMKQLRGRHSGLCQPTYVLDIPGGYGKVPIGPNYVNPTTNNAYDIEDYQGNTHLYTLHE